MEYSEHQYSIVQTRRLIAAGLYYVNCVLYFIQLFDELET